MGIEKEFEDQRSGMEREAAFSADSPQHPAHKLVSRVL